MKSIIPILCIVFLISCYSENEEDLFGNDGLMSRDSNKVVTFKGDIEPLFRQNCSTPGCHVPRGIGNGLLQTYSQIKNIADNGKLKDRVIVQMNMPQAGPLSPSKIALIQSWIDNGSPNN